MARALSNDLRIRIIEDVESGMSCRAASRKYRVSPSCVTKLVQRYKETGSYTPLPRGGDQRSYLGPYMAFIDGLIEDNPCITLEEIHHRIFETFDIKVHISIIDRFVRKLGWRYKKNHARRRTGA